MSHPGTSDFLFDPEKKTTPEASQVATNTSLSNTAEWRVGVNKVTLCLAVCAIPTKSIKLTGDDKRRDVKCTMNP